MRQRAGYGDEVNSNPYRAITVRLMAGCRGNDLGADSSESNQMSAQAPVSKTTSLDYFTDLNSSMLISCGACRNKISRPSLTCVGCAHPTTALRKSFADYQQWKVKRGDLEKVLSALKREAEYHREFLDRLH
jgi:hypothetical protein